MLSSLSYFFNKNSGFDGRFVDSSKLNKVGVYKYEYLDTKEKPSESKPKKRVRFESSEAFVEEDKYHFDGGVDEKRGAKLKILMTKEEAARLLSKCKDGGVLELEDVARELVQIPINRVSLVSCSSHRSSDCRIQNVTDKED